MEPSVSFLRHAVLGSANAMSLSAAALAIKMPIDDQVQFLEDLARSADALIDYLDRYESRLEASPSGN